MKPTGGSVVVVDYQLTGEEFRRAVRWAIRRRPSTLVLAALGPLFILIGLIFGTEAGSFFLGLGLAMLGVLVVGLALMPAIAWRRNEWVRGARNVAISDEGVQTRTSISEGLVQWSAFKSSYETDQSYMLRMVTRVYLIVLKRAFASAEDEARFRELLERHTAARLWSPDHM